jgi:hypothetical protein
MSARKHTRQFKGGLQTEINQRSKSVEAAPATPPTTAANLCPITPRSEQDQIQT